MKHTISARWRTNSNRAYKQLAHTFWSSYECLFIVLKKWSYRSPQSCWLLNLEWLRYFEDVVQSFFKTRVFLVTFLTSTLDHTPLIYRCPDYCCVQYRHTYLNGSIWVLLATLFFMRRPPNSCRGFLGIGCCKGRCGPQGSGELFGWPRSWELGFIPASIHDWRWQ